MPSYLGGIEAGGTKFVCAVSDRDTGEIIIEERFPTTDPTNTLARAVAFFKDAASQGKPIDALGIGTFGPAGVNPALSNYGKILATPKEGWEGADFIGAFQDAFPELAIAFDTDVNAAAIGEGSEGAAKGLSSYVYITVGTGIGGGVVINNQVIQGYLHPEIGHISIRREEGDDYAGACPFHQDCVEGLASGTAINQRWGMAAQDMPEDHPAWQLEAKYLAALCQTLTATLSPERIILGGGVMLQKHLLPMIQQEFNSLTNGYWQTPENYIVTPKLGNHAGIIGCLKLATSSSQTGN